MSNNEFTIDEEVVDGVNKLVLKGRITSFSANVLQHKLEEVVKAGEPDVVVNMTQIEFLSSAGIRVLLMFYKKAKEIGSGFHIENPSENVVNVLGLTALDEMLLK